MVDLNEHSFVKSIHRLLPKEIYRWKINDKFTGGVPDAYYEGPKGSLWIEYKFIKSLPKRKTTILRLGLSLLQVDWLNRAVDNNVNAWVVVGSNNGCLVLRNKHWTNTIHTNYYDLYSVTNRQLVTLISSNTLLHQDQDNDTDESSTKSVTKQPTSSTRKLDESVEAKKRRRRT